ncbi:MAG: amino acid permease [Bacteroidota bacterium]|nr:amino acid permease [Candidatus Kapabacteria bacterium]MCS7302578.1 amino acid permease [Candidatus Kapabacteria bacterium]MDW8074231.1 amino acid permease [Bacteroidota bacterium]MDW8271293.1 amino acid permease [Bacteroidota bacterium]
MEQATTHGEFRRTVTLLDATMVVAGIMIGSGIFIVSADIARTVGAAGWLLVVWLITGVLTLIGALSYGELAAMFPTAGGQYIYLREAYNPLIAFLYGWTFFLVIQTGSIAAVAVAFAKFTAVLFPIFSETNILVRVGVVQISMAHVLAIAVIVILTWLNTRGIQLGTLVQNIFTFGKIGSLIALIALAFIGYNHEAIEKNLATFWDAQTVRITAEGKLVVTTLSGIGLIIALAVAQVGSLFSSDGWNNITFAASEVVRPQRTIPLALGLGTVIVTVLYLLVNVAYIVTLPVQGVPSGASPMEQGIQFAAADRVGAAAAEVMFPGIGAALMAILIMISTFGCDNGMILAGARCYYAMAQDGLFFASVGQLNRMGAPATALWVQAAWSSLLCLSGRYSDLLDYVVFAVLLFYVLTVAGIFILRWRKPDVPRPVKAIGYPLLPALYILATAFICVVLLIEKPNYTYPGLGIVFAGVPVYYLWQALLRKRHTEVIRKPNG